MDITDKLRRWGSALAAARVAERAVARDADITDTALRREAEQLREHANRLHGEIYQQLDRR